MQQYYPRIGILMICLLLTNLAGCLTIPASDNRVDEAQMAVAVQQTLSAKESQDKVQATLVALSVQSTALVLQLTQQAILQAAKVPPTAAPVQSANPPIMLQPTPVVQFDTPAQPLEFEEWKNSATILLYEDMVNLPKIARYIKNALGMMGLKYKDDGSAKGLLKNDILSGGPNGKPWDVIIVSAEYRTSPSGEFFDYISDALNKGSSVILEVWYLDRVFNGRAQPLMGRCGLTFQDNFEGKSNTPADLVVYPVMGVDHPILHQPNANIRYTNVHVQWPYSDLGDLMMLTGNGDARILLGTLATDPAGHGVLAVCMNDRFILQTFSTHDLAMDSAVPLWQNYIYNALQARFRSQ
jgi:hypothetical protein